MSGREKYTIVYGDNVALGFTGFGYITPIKEGEKLYCLLEKGKTIGDRYVYIYFCTCSSFISKCIFISPPNISFIQSGSSPSTHTTIVYLSTSFG